MNFMSIEITDLAKKNIEVCLKSWNVKENVRLFVLPMGIVAQYINNEDEIEYRAFTDFGTPISHHVYSNFEQTTLELIYEAEPVLIDAAERVLKK